MREARPETGGLLELAQALREQAQAMKAHACALEALPREIHASGRAVALELGTALILAMIVRHFLKKLP